VNRIPQEIGRKGSLRWIQVAIENHRQMLNEAISTAARTSPNVEWLSPLKGDSYAEYRDEGFLRLLGLDPAALTLPLHKFWPAKGPQWDALGRTERGELILVEAKSHIPELKSVCGATDARSRRLIRASIDRTKVHLGVEQSVDWMGPFYQYANRLAHLHYLSTLNKVDAVLIFLYFMNDPDQNGPTTQREWEAASSVVRMTLGLPKRIRLRRVANVFIDVGNWVGEVASNPALDLTALARRRSTP
jgi:hypothetical protein